jgi:hypothetical protein
LTFASNGFWKNHIKGTEAVGGNNQHALIVNVINISHLAFLDKRQAERSFKKCFHRSFEWKFKHYFNLNCISVVCGKICP